MSKSSKQLFKTIIAVSIITVACVLSVSIIMARVQNDKLMSDRANVAMGVIKNEIDNRVEEITTITYSTDVRQMTDAMCDGFDEAKIAEAWNLPNIYETIFAACYDSTGAMRWRSENCELTSSAVAPALNGNEISGIMRDNSGRLYLGCATPVISEGVVGVLLLGEDLSKSPVLDNIKEQTGAEVTIFSGTTRFATTVINNGQRAVGTEMADNVARRVITNGETYVGTADVVGQNHYVYYEPLFTSDGEKAGAYFTGYSSAESDRSFLKMTLISVAVGLVIFGLACVVIVYMMLKLLDRPIVAAAAMVEQISAGNLSAPRTKVMFSDDGVGLFVKHIDIMRERLNDYINDISNVLKNMAEGNFTAKTVVAYSGDFEKIQHSFEDIKNQLNSIILNIAQSTDHVSISASELSSGTQELAEGCINQSEQIGTLSEAIDNIGDAAERNAANAVKANSLSKKAGEQMEISNSEMAELLKAMTNIEEKSNRIGDIIKAIEDIAFQTNILALNAAIEAARAGDAGKGFAVVADEVRTLAARSAEAAGRTNELISSTIEAVSAGASVASSTAAAMNTVAELAQQSSMLVDEISVDSKNQANNVKLITESIHEISNVVRQNTATSEQSAAACEELSGMAGELKAQTARLKV